MRATTKVRKMTLKQAEREYEKTAQDKREDRKGAEKLMKRHNERANVGKEKRK